jgi:hypothetical protein
VAAQGGGIYAAYHTAILLSRIEDYCPEFRNHLFAISSVSGGSLGAAVFASLTKALAHTHIEQGTDEDVTPEASMPEATIELPCPVMERGTLRSFSAPKPGAHELAARRILASNFLAPLAAGALFPDFLQRFLFFPVPKFDRARWLEGAFEDSWHQAEESWSRAGDNPFKRENPFKESVLSLWSPDGAAPALLINTTEVDSGRRLVISPFKIEKRGPVRGTPEGPAPWETILGPSGQMNRTTLLPEGRPEVLQFPLWNQNLLNPPPAM